MQVVTRITLRYLSLPVLPSNVKAMNTYGLNKKCLAALPSTLCPPCLYPRVVPKKSNNDSKKSQPSTFFIFLSYCKLNMNIETTSLRKGKLCMGKTLFSTEVSLTKAAF